MPDEPAPREAAAPTPPAAADPGYDSSGVPTFESVREKIETRYATALGSAELTAETADGRDVEERYQARARAAADKLSHIRESMHHSPDGRGQRPGD